MSIKPILFNTEMVQAIIDGRKTQTRRIIQPQPTNPRRNHVGWLGWDDGHGYRMKPPCEAGDILWVRETWCEPYMHGQYVYRADYPDEHDIVPNNAVYEFDNELHISVSANLLRWRPSIHMPRSAARIFLRVKDVWVERLYDMIEEDAIAEGFADLPAGTDSPLQRFSELWDKTIKRDSLREFGYHANPWVWAISFERCDKPEGWC